MSEQFKLVGGHIALDFSNTLDNRYDPEHTVDLIGSYKGLLAFCEQAGILNRRESKQLALSKKPLADAVWESARELRDLIEKIFSSAAEKRRVPEADLERLNLDVAKALLHRKLSRDPQGVFRWIWTGLETHTDAPVWMIAFAAAELLASEDLQFVRECQSDTCRWLFLDLSKNHSRRWCDMKLCGNRNKAKRHYEKRV